MIKNEKQFKGIPPAVIFMPSTYRQYIDAAQKLYLLNLYAVEDYCNLDVPPYDLGVEIYHRLNSFRSLCVDLMNTDCQHGYYRPDALDIRRLLAWHHSNTALYQKLSHKVSGLEEWI
ncbi:TPA: hypothetical protein R0445_000296 [Salmonella enterica subsp. enterica serovar Hvittingfoss]|nr:hypothetical protein [Salmonella enterica subsp. enterica serovar Hvittingfoss]